MKRGAWAVGVAAAAAAVGFGVYTQRAAAPKAPSVTFGTASVEVRTVVGRVTATGTLQATVTVQVGTQVSGRIQKLFADFNTPVKKGQLVAKIDPRLFEAAVAQARANVLAARANLVKAQAQVRDAETQNKRTRALFDEGLASASELLTSDTNVATTRASVDVARASVEQAEAALHQASVNLAFTDIVSPIDGVVLARNVDVGQTVAASLQTPTLFTIAEDLRKMQVNTSVSEGDVGRLEPGMAASFTVDAYPGARFSGKIGQIRNAAQTVQNVVTYNAVIDVENTDLRLRPGMTANVSVVFAERASVLALPNAALRFRPPPEVASAAAASAAPSSSNGARPDPSARPSRRGPPAGREGAEAPPDTRTVWRAEGATARPVTVRVGLSDGSWTELAEGPLKAGDAVVVDATVAGKPSASAPSGPAMRRLF